MAKEKHTLYYLRVCVCRLISNVVLRMCVCTRVRSGFCVLHDVRALGKRAISSNLLVDCWHSSAILGQASGWIRNRAENCPKPAGSRAQRSSIAIYAGGAMRVNLSKTRGTKGTVVIRSRSH